MSLLTMGLLLGGAYNSMRKKHNIALETEKVMTITKDNIQNIEKDSIKLLNKNAGWVQ